MNEAAKISVTVFAGNLKSTTAAATAAAAVTATLKSQRCRCYPRFFAIGLRDLIGGQNYNR
jgi:hypothetical protein